MQTAEVAGHTYLNVVRSLALFEQGLMPISGMHVSRRVLEF